MWSKLFKDSYESAAVEYDFAAAESGKAAGYEEAAGNSAVTEGTFEVIVQLRFQTRSLEQI